MNPLVSICCITYNHEKYISDAIEGFLAQKTKFNYEIIIHDDASTDSTVNIIKQYEEKYKGIIKTITQHENQLSQGKKPFYNFVLPKTKGNYIVICEGDDFWTDPLKLQLQVDLLEKNKEYSACFHPVYWLENDKIRENVYSPLKIKSYYDLNDVLENVLQITVCSTVFRKSSLSNMPVSLLNVPYWDNVLHTLNAINGNIAYINKPMATYRRHSGGYYSGDSESNRIINTIETWRAIEKEFGFTNNIHLLKRYSTLLKKLNRINKEEYIKHNNIIENEWMIETRPNVNETAKSHSDFTAYFNNAQKLLANKDFKSAEHEIQNYRNNIDYNLFSLTDNRVEINPIVSVIIVAYNTNELLIECVNSLRKQTNQNFEVIIVDNGKNDSVKESLLSQKLFYVGCPTNLILSEGRNIGAHFAKGKIIAFLDDDAVVDENYVDSLISAFNNETVYALRGKVLPKTNHKNNSIAGHYDLGEDKFPYLINTEGNSAFRKEIYLELGGMDPLLFGYEGTDLSYRMYKQYGRICSYYDPRVIIYHDFAQNDTKLSAKNERHSIMLQYLRVKHTDIMQFISSFNENYKKKYSKQETSKEYDTYDVVMVWYQNDWGLFGRRNEMFARELAKSHKIRKVLHLEPPIRSDLLTNKAKYDLDQKSQAINRKRVECFNDNGIITFTPSYENKLDEQQIISIKSQIHKVIKRENLRNVVLWLYPPHWLSLEILNKYGRIADLIVSDLVDDHRKYCSTQSELNQIESSYSKIVKASNITFGVSPKLISDFKDFSNNIYFIPNGVDEETLNYQSSILPKELRDLRSPIIGYVGALSFRLDLDLIENLIKTNKEISFVFIGPAPSQKMQEFAEYENVLLIEPKSKEEINTYIQCFDACIVPHEVNDITDKMNPIKIYEYLANGKPVISTRIAGTEDLSELIYIANDKNEFNNLIKKALNENTEQKTKQRKEICKTQTWRKRISTIFDLINSVDKNTKSTEGKNKMNGYYQFSRPEVQALVNKNSEYILDIGCSSGNLGLELKNSRNAKEVWGIEPFAEAAREAKEKLSNVLENKVEEAVKELPDKKFDTIIMADVLEHLENPYKVLEDLRPKFSDKGEIVISIPNVNHFTVFKKLLEGDWKYEDAGILDKTHLRFFTRKSVIRMLKDTGYQITDMKATTFGEFKLSQESLEALKKDGIDTTHLNENLNHYQYLVKASPLNRSLKTSIIVPVYNQLRYTKEFIESVFNHTHSEFEIILVDNNSNQESIEYLQSIEKSDERIKVIHNRENYGFPKAVNQGIKISSGDYIVIANNDIVVTDNWLDKLIQAAESQKEIGMVGPISNIVSGVQVDEKAEYKSIDEMHKYAAKVSEKNKGELLEFPRIAFLCTLIKRDVIEKIGGLDERYSPGNFEDDDFCLRTQLLGYKTVIAKDVFIHHYGSKSFKADGENAYADRMQINKKKFIDKWGADPNEIWLEGKNIRKRGIKYPIDSDEFVESFSRTILHSEENELKLALEEAGRSVKTFDENQRNGFEKISKTDVLNFAGNLALQVGDLEKAQEYFKSELELSPESGRACLGLAETFFGAELFEEAKTMYEWAIKNGESKEMIMSKLEIVNKNLGMEANHTSLDLSNCHSGNSLEEAEELINNSDLNGAEEILNKLLQKDPQSLDALNDMAVVRIMQENYEQALKIINEVVELDPTNETAIGNLQYIEEVLSQSV